MKHKIFDNIIMKNEEKLVKTYLGKIFINSDISPEPDGNVPPDFLIDNKLAIEVRRLNENRRLFEGIEKLQYSISEIVQNVIENINKKIKDDFNNSYYIDLCLESINFKKNSYIKKELYNRLLKFYSNNLHENEEFNIDNINFRIYKNENNKVPFILGGFIDNDEGGFLFEIYKKNIKLCIDEKFNKIKKNAKRQYEEWWLILVDYVTPDNISNNIISNLDKKIFSKIIILNLNGTLKIKF